MIRDRNATGNSRFEGYLIDLITTLSVRLKFDFELYEVEDGNYGTQNASGDWNGMIGDLISGVRTLQLIGHNLAYFWSVFNVLESGYVSGSNLDHF